MGTKTNKEKKTMKLKKLFLLIIILLNALILVFSLAIYTKHGSGDYLVGIAVNVSIIFIISVVFVANTFISHMRGAGKNGLK